MAVMETTRIDNRIGVKASAERIWDVLSDLEGWHRWNPYETQLSGRLGFGAAVNFQEAFPGLPSRQASASISEWEPCGQLLLSERRGFLFGTVRYFEIEPLEKNASVLTNGILFTGLRGEMHFDKVRKILRPVVLDINERLKAVIEQG